MLFVGASIVAAVVVIVFKRIVMILTLAVQYTSISDLNKRRLVHFGDQALLLGGSDIFMEA